MVSAYVKKHKPWITEEELRGFVDSNRHAFFKFGTMLAKKHGEKIWDFWDEMDFDEQESFLDEARIAYPEPEPPVVDTMDFKRGVPEEVAVDEDGGMML